MSRNRDDLLPVPDALFRVTAGIAVTKPEQVALEAATGRILAADLVAGLTQPPFDASAMDGYAVRSTDTATVPRDLHVVGTAAAGHPFSGNVESGEAVRIFTGGAVPAGADAVVIQEDVRAAEETITLVEPVEAGAFVRPRGFDFHEGDVLLRAGRRLGARELTLAAAMNVPRVRVRRQPLVAVLATGDELVPLGKTPGEGQIISSIPYGLAAMIEAAGGLPLRLGIAQDSHESLADHLSQASDADILVTIGGASVGDHDLVQDALRRRGMELDFWKIAMRPGKPLMFGVLGKQRVLGVPGNPVSALICARIFLVPMLACMLGRQEQGAGETRVRLGAELPENGPRQHYLRATLTTVEDDLPIATPVRSQDSSLLSPLAEADCLLVRPPFAARTAAGEVIGALLLDF